MTFKEAPCPWNVLDDKEIQAYVASLKVNEDFDYGNDQVDRQELEYDEAYSAQNPKLYFPSGWKEFDVCAEIDKVRANLTSGGDCVRKALRKPWEM